MAKSKNEIDKELMYRKIMPTRAQVHTVSEEDRRLLSPETPEPGAPQITSRTSPYAASRVFQDTKDMLLTNIMEHLVLSRLDNTLSRFHCCKCNRCKRDIAALALNRLPARYVVAKENDEDTLKREEERYASEVTGALVQAIMVVMKHPRH